MAPTHGIASTYRSRPYNCRCDLCRAAHATLQRELNRRRAQRLADEDAAVAHGTYSTYTNWGCRCTECTAANAAACKARYDKRVGK
jgi:hypothetical protein